MLVIKKPTGKHLVMGHGLLDTFAKVGNFLLQNKDTISSVSGIAKDVTGAVGSSANAYKEIAEAIKLQKNFKSGQGCRKAKLTAKNRQILQSLAKAGSGYKFVS